ncbi:hypothetical protein [Actinomycetospora termitidis]|uniref:Uncharacterized protein n=1 Tax=Actinomycetospora termitidis TaxID=3053470 RepID=A0ABT7MHW6_9PSEU|nr:hypothetical protein [Actinomycetospora sp. Odt1-22]MDL5160269.1 hypothetical protein [Actinomycetospora sp. Odt1-22]
MTTNDALARVAEQRERLAERARLPWWFWVLFSVATVGLVGCTLIQDRLPAGVGTWLVVWPSILVYLVAEWLVRRTRGISLSRRTFRDYPSARLPSVLFLVAALVGMFVVMVTAHVRPDIAVVALVVAAPLAVGAMVWVQHAMLADIRTGRVRTP